MSDTSNEKREGTGGTHASITSKKNISVKEGTVTEDKLNEENKSIEASVRFEEIVAEIPLEPLTAHSSHLGFHHIRNRIEEPSNARRSAHPSRLNVSYESFYDEGDSMSSEDGTKGKTDAHYAAKEGDLELLSKINHRSKLNVRDDDGWSPIMYAALSGQLAAMQLLKDKGADMKAMDPQGRSLLHIAASFGHEHVINWLLELGFDVNVTDFYEMTPLHLAAATNQASVTSLLLANGADTTIENDRNRTPLRVAQIAGHPEIIDLLRDTKNDDF